MNRLFNKYIKKRILNCKWDNIDWLINESNKNIVNNFFSLLDL